MDDYTNIFAAKSVVMVVMAHPDDLDAMCGGTVARLCADGKTVISIKATTGNYGSRDSKISPSVLAKQRADEDAKAMKTLGVLPQNSISLDRDDGTIENTKDLIEQISYYIRKFQPQLIITTNPEDVVVTKSSQQSWVNHRDHRNIAGATIDAAYPFSRDRSFFAKQLEDKSLLPGNCNEILIADFNRGEPQVKIAIDDFGAKKLAALKFHKSQFSTETANKVFEMYSSRTDNHTYETFRHVKFA